MTKTQLIELKEKLQERWRGRLSLLDHLIRVWESPQEQKPVAQCPDDKAPAARLSQNAKPKPKRGPKAASHRQAIRNAVENCAGPFCADQIAKDSGEKLSRVSSALSPWLKQGYLVLCGSANNRVLYQKTDKLVSDVAAKYREFRKEIETKDAPDEA